MARKFDAYFISLHIALVALCVVTVLLAIDNRRLKQPASGGFDAGGPVVGQSVQPVPWETLDGGQQTLELAGGERDSLLLVFTTECPACRENQTAWRGLHQEVGNDVEVVGISLSALDDTRTYRDTHQLSFPVGVPTDPGSFASQLAITGVPMTIRVGADGRVQGSWSGILSKQQISEVTRFDRG